MTLVIAHRGASRAEPENTIAAFRRAAEMGADGVELDVRRSVDDRLIVHHDPVLADGRLIRDTPSTELPDQVAHLGDALDACAGMFVNIEIKNDPSEPDFDPTEWLAHRVSAMLQSRPDPSRWLISSFRNETIDVCRRLAPWVRTAALTMETSDEALSQAADGGHAAIHPFVGAVTEAAIRGAHALGLAVNTWTCDDPDRMRELIGWGIDGICTNVPDVAVDVRSG